MATVAFPPDIQQFVRAEITVGKYASEQELIVEAVRLLRDSEARFEEFRKDLRAEFERIDRGEGTVLEGDDALAACFEELKAEALTELANERVRGVP
jgi:putative addiction module CopG family antidote